MNNRWFFCKRIALGIFLLNFISLGNRFAQEKSKTDYISDLSSKKDQLVMIACGKLGKNKSENIIRALIKVLEEHKNPKVRIAAASALGQTGVKGVPTNALSKAIQNDDSNDVIYSALLAIGNLKDFNNPNVKASLKYCKKNKHNDPFIKDIVVRVYKFLGNK